MSIVAVLLWVAAFYRVRLSLRAPVTLWRNAFTAAVVLVALAVTVYAHPWVLDRAVPNLSVLVIHLLTLASAGCVVVYLLTLTNEHVAARVLQAIGGLAGAVMVLETVTWLVAPIHRRDVTDLGALPHDAIVAHYVVHYAALTAVLAVTSILCFRMAFQFRRPDVSGTLGLVLIAVGTGFGALAQLAWLVRTWFVHNGTDVEQLRAFGDAVAPWCLTAIAVGTLCVVLGPAAEESWRARRLTRQLAPLHRQVLALYPEVGLPLPGQPRSRLVLQRMKIEVHDGLERIVLSSGGDGSPYRRIAHALAHPSTGRVEGVRASQILPRAADERADEQGLARLAAAYREVR